MGEFIGQIKRLLKIRWKQSDTRNKARMSTTQEAPSKSQSSGSRIENGREFNEQENVQYMLPKDVQELDRLHQQHWMLKVAFQGNFEAPIEDDLKKGITVLDSGCGPGTWTLEMAETYPNTRFHGMDVVPVFPEQIKPPNCDFRLGNLNEKIPYPDNYFDYIHQRLLVLGLTVEGWENAVKELVRVAKPGGWIELTEVKISLSPLGPQGEKFIQICHRVLKSKNFYADVAGDLGAILEKSGCEDVNVTKLNVPLNHGGLLGTLFWTDLREVFYSLEPVFKAADPETYGDFDKAMEAVAAEFAEYGTMGHWYAAYGRKLSA